MNKKSAWNVQEKPKVLNKNIDRGNVFCTFLFEFVAMDINLLFPIEPVNVYEWFYASVKAQKFSNSTYSQSIGRDPNAYKKTETFRKTWRNADSNEFTVEFLGTIVQKIRFFKYRPEFPMTTFYDFVRFTIKATTKMMMDSPNSYNDHEKYGNDFLLARILCRHLMMWGFVLVFNEWDQPIRTVVASDGWTEALLLAAPDDLETIENIENLTVKEAKFIDYNKRAFFTEGLHVLFIAHSHNAGHKGFTSCYYAFIPLNKKGKKSLLEGELFEKELTTELIYRLNDTDSHLADAMYCDIAFFDTAINTSISSFYLYVVTVATFLGLNIKNLVIYLAADTNPKRDLIRLLNMKEVIPKKDRKVSMKNNATKKAIYGIEIGEIQT